MKQRSESLAWGDIVSVISHTLGAMNHYLVQLMAREGLNGIVPSHGDILMQLFAHNTMPMAALASAIGKDPSTVTALVRKLMAAGYVEKTPSETDRRVNEVRLTEQGRALKPVFDRISEELITALGEGMTDTDMETTYRTLRAMQDNLNDRFDS